MKNILLLISYFIGLAIFAQDTPLPFVEGNNIYLDSTLLIKYELPQIKNTDTVVTHFAYSLNYNEVHEQANWVAYELNEEETKGIVARSNKFIIDPFIATGSATNQDYLNSGYDRGHLAPAADMKWTEVAMTESFYYSNMSPQNPNFNRGIWKKLEEQVRSWVVLYNRIYIATGPVLKDGLPAIGPNRVSIPEYYYKTVLTFSHEEPKVIAFLIPNKASKSELSSFVLSIDSLESLTNINFYPALIDSIENKIEIEIKIDNWNWDFKKQESQIEDSEHGEAAIQCKGKTKTGKRCLKKTKSNNGFCNMHGG